MQRRSVFRNTAVLPVRAIAFAAAILFSFVASYVHAQEITITSPTATTEFDPGATFSIDVTPGGETAALLASNPTTPRLTSTFSLTDAELKIEAVAVNNANAAAVRNGIVIGFPRAVYDSITGDGLGGVTTDDNLQIRVGDFNTFPAILRLDNARSGTTRYSPPEGSGRVGSLSPLGAVHIITFFNGVGPPVIFAVPSLQQTIHLIQAHEITILPDYAGGSFNLVLTLRESSNASLRIGARDTITTEIMVELSVVLGVPTVPNNKTITAVAGDTSATLTWAAAQIGAVVEDVQYEATLTEGEVSSMFTISMGAYTLDGATPPRASFTLDRATAVLLPGKSYELTMLACDTSGQCSDEAEEYSGTFETTSLGPVTNGIHDELAGVVEGNIATYCGGGGDHADGDGDGVPNSVEVRIGTDCRSGAANDFVGASRPVLTISQTGAETVNSEVYLVRPGTGSITEISGVTCTSCTMLEAYENATADGSSAASTCTPELADSDPMGHSGCRAVEINKVMDTNDYKMLLGSFSREILLVARDDDDNWAMQMQRFYIQPPVGFDVSRARADGGMVDLPFSVAVSSDVGSFEAEVELTGVTESAAPATVRSVFSGVSVTLTDGMATVGVGLSLTGNNDAIPGDTSPDFSEPYVLGNSTVTVSALAQTQASDQPVFVFDPQPLFVDDSETGLPAFNIASSTPPAEMYQVTATILQRALPLPVSSSVVTTGQDVTVSFGGNVRAGDIIEVKATGMTANQTVVGTFFISVVYAGRSPDNNGNGIPDLSENAGLKRHELQISDDSLLEVSGGRPVLGGYAAAASSATNTWSAAIPDDSTIASTATGEIGTPGGYPETGVFDFIVTGVAPGGVASVLIPLRNSVTQTGLRLFKYDNDDGGRWSQFTSGPADAYYGAPAPCPAISAPRGTGAGEWRAADDSGFQVGDECVLLEITDGGMNDTDGTRNGVIYDPNALGSSGTGGTSGAGGGATDPVWLLLASLALALSYASRRRQRNLR